MSRDRTANEIARHTAEAAHLLAALGDGDDEFAHDLIEGETGLLEAIDAALDEIDGAEIIIDGCAAKVSQYTERKRRAEARRDRVRGLIEQAMQTVGLDKIKRPAATLSLTRRPPAPVVTDESAIPERFWRHPPPVLDRAAIVAATKDGEKIPGVTMSNGSVSLTKRRT